MSLSSHSLSLSLALAAFLPLAACGSPAPDGETSVTAATDEALTSVCASGARRCDLLQDSALTCVSGQWQATACAIGCEAAQCAVCTDGDLLCTASHTVRNCSGGQWQTTTTPCSSAKVAVGEGTSYLLGNASLTAWGRGAEGELGNGTAPKSGTATPMPVSLAGKVFDVVAAGQNACALVTDGTVWCWGARDGVIPVDGSDSGAAQSTPVQIPLLGNVTQIAIGGMNGAPAHACAISNGAVYCWGDNSEWEVGVASTAPQKPTAVGLTGVTQISLGDPFSCALLTNGGVRCWGGDDEGELAIAPAAGESYTPVTIPLLPATEIFAGRNSECALTKSGVYECWGDNDQGELGLGNKVTPITTPTQAANLATATALSLGVNHSCGIFAGAAKCWGDNANSTLGNGTLPSLVPVQALALTTGVTSIAVATDHVCALASGVASCWGLNDQGQLGSTK